MRIQFWFLCAFVLLTAVLLFVLLTMLTPFNIIVSPLASASIVLLLTIFGLITSVRYLSRSRSPTQNISSLPAHNSSTKKKETEFVAETYQSVVSKLQIDRRHLTELQAQADLRAASAERFSRRVISGLPSGLIAFDAAGMVRVINEPARDLIKCGGDTNEKHFTQIFEQIPELREMIQTTLERGILFRRETVFLRQEKTRRLGVTVAPLDDGILPNKQGALCLLIDITEISDLREQLALKQNLASLGEMAAGLTHEFKNSLAAIGSYAQFLQSIGINENGKTAASALLGEVRNLSDIVTAFLDFARPQPLNLTTVDLFELLSECVVELEPLFLKLRIELKIEGSFSIIQADEQMLRRVFLNLLRNAAEAFTDDAQIRLIIICAGSFLDENKRSWANVEIMDSGGGIAEKDLPFLFVPFYTTKSGGHGIGLALSHRIVSEHGGCLTAVNSEFGGAVFNCAFPLFKSREF